MKSWIYDKKVIKFDKRVGNVCFFGYYSGGHKVQGFLAEPAKGKNLPAIIWNRGGSLDYGLMNERKILNSSILTLMRQGYVVIGSQYSGNKTSEGKDEFGGSDLADVLELYNILKTNPKVDLKRIGMYGASRGTMMTLLASIKVRWIKAAVLKAPLTNLVAQKTDWPKMYQRFKLMFGGSIVDMKTRSAVYWPDKLNKKVPLLLMHGTSDWRIKVENTIKFSEILIAYKIPFRLILYEGANHGIGEFKNDVTSETIAWFDRYVKGNTPLPNLKLHGK